jgi:DNA repair protein RadC
MTGPHLPELGELQAVLGEEAGELLARAPGGWRSLSEAELAELVPDHVDAVLALQQLVRRDYPCLSVGALANPRDVARVYSDWLGSLRHEVVLALALDGRNHLLQELEVARGGIHGAALTPVDIFRPLIRAGAHAFLLCHNHPSGDPNPSAEDVSMTRAVAEVGDIIGIPLLDHIVVGARGGGWTSLLDLGLIQETGDAHQRRVAEPSDASGVSP